ncbi:MAG: hypothetical protein ACE5JX_21160 [Acidobacteriota bacterium]
MYKPFSTATGSFNTYGHMVTLSALGLDLETMAYFPTNRDFPRNVLGREGWLRQTRLGIVDYDGLMYVSDYNDLSTPIQGG